MLAKFHLLVLLKKALEYPDKYSEDSHYQWVENVSKKGG